MSRTVTSSIQSALASTPRSSLLPLGALAAGFGLAMPAFSQTTQDSADEAMLAPVSAKAKAEFEDKNNVQAVTSTIGKGNQDIRDIPQSLTVVTEKLMDDAKLDTLKQALHYTAGITFAATENGTDQDIRLRGFPVATVGDLLIDGMRDPSQYDRDTFNYERIEVLRGSASMLFGRGSTGGVINQVTKQPALANLNEVDATYGSYNYQRLTADFNVRTGEHSALRVNAMGNKADNAGAEIEKYGLAPTFAWGIGTNDQFAAGAFYLNVDNIPMAALRYLSGSVADAIPAKNFYGSHSDYMTGEALYGTAAWTHRFDGGGVLRTQLRSGTYDRAQWGTTAGFCSVPLNAAQACPAGSPAVTSTTLNDNTAMTRSGLSPRQDEYSNNFIQSDYSNNFNWAGKQHAIIAGVDAAYETADRFLSNGAVGTNYNKGGTTVGNPNDGSTTALTPVYRKSSDYTAHAAGAFAQDLMSLTQHWKLLAGLRYDWFKADTTQINYSSNTPSGVVTTTPTSELSYPSLWSYRAGLLYQPTISSSYHLSYGTSFNTSADTYQYTTPQTANTPAEKSRNIELGAKLDWLDGQLSTRMAIFFTEKYNERTTDSDFAGTSYLLSGKRHAQGVELDVVGRITPALEIYTSYSYIGEAKIDKAGSSTAQAVASVGQSVGLTPKHTGSVWVSYQALNAVRLAAGARGASENHPLQGGTGAALQTAKAPGYVAFDAMAEYRFNPDIVAQLNITNLTDKVYGDQLYPGFYIAGEARSFKLTLGVLF